MEKKEWIGKYSCWERVSLCRLHGINSLFSIQMFITRKIRIYPQSTTHQKTPRKYGRHIMLTEVFSCYFQKSIGLKCFFQEKGIALLKKQQDGKHTQPWPGQLLKEMPPAVLMHALMGDFGNQSTNKHKFCLCS